MKIKKVLKIIIFVVIIIGLIVAVYIVITNFHNTNADQNRICPDTSKSKSFTFKAEAKNESVVDTNINKKKTINTITKYPVEKLSGLSVKPFKEFSFPAKEGFNNTDYENGVFLFIPENCFELNGKIYQGDVKFFFRSFTTLSEIVLSGLSTIGEDGPLATYGMYELQAYTPQGEVLAIRNGKQIYLEKHEGKIKGDICSDVGSAKLYTGEFDKNNNLVWKNPKELNKKMIPIPWNLLYLNGNSHGIPLYKVHCTPTDKVDSSYIITREMQNRYHMIGNSFFDRILLGTYDKDRKFTINPNLWKTIKNKYLIHCYADNITKNLWKADLEFYKEFKQSNIKSLNPDLENYSWQWYKQKLTTIETYDSKGVDLNGTNAYDSLLLKGFTPIGAEQLLDKYKLRKIIIDTLSQRLDKRGLSFLFSVYYAGTLNHLTIYNIDKYKNNDNIVDLKLNVINNDKISFDVKCLIINNKYIMSYDSGGYDFKDVLGNSDVTILMLRIRWDNPSIVDYVLRKTSLSNKDKTIDVTYQTATKKELNAKIKFELDSRPFCSKPN